MQYEQDILQALDTPHAVNRFDSCRYTPQQKVNAVVGTNPFASKQDKIRIFRDDNLSDADPV